MDSTIYNDCKLQVGPLKIYGNLDGRGVFHLGNPDGRRGLAVLEIPEGWEWGGGGEIMSSFGGVYILTE